MVTNITRGSNECKSSWNLHHVTDNKPLQPCMDAKPIIITKSNYHYHGDSVTSSVDNGGDIQSYDFQLKNKLGNKMNEFFIPHSAPAQLFFWVCVFRCSTKTRFISAFVNVRQFVAEIIFNFEHHSLGTLGRALRLLQSRQKRKCFQNQQIYLNNRITF